MDEERLTVLLHRYFDQLLTKEERRELELLLLAFPQARKEFWEMARWNALLRQWGEAEWGRFNAENPRFQMEAQTDSAPLWARLCGHVRRWRWPLATTAATTAILLIGFLGYQAWFPPKEHSLPSGIAVLTKISETAWDKNHRSVQIGEMLQPGWFRLERGAVQIEFALGARVVLQAPAELRLISENEAYLSSGRLSAYVPPPAHGFKITTPTFTVVDHGTQFGCVVGQAGTGEVQVFAGKVSWQLTDTDNPGLELSKDHALAISNQVAQPIPVNRAAFLSEDELARLDAERQRDHLATWQAGSRWLRENPATQVYLDFEGKTRHSQVIVNRAQHAPANSDASIIGCNLTAGRWTDKKGMEFKSPNDRLRLTLPGEFSSLTLIAWIRVDSLPPIQASLLMTDSFAKGETHWSIHRDGSLGIGVHTDSPDTVHGWRGYGSPSRTLSPYLGRWIMVASVFDGATGSVTHYLNGEPISSGKLVVRVPLRLDTFEIGNWGVRADDPRWNTSERKYQNDVRRNFDGCMDEFAILATPVPANDIQWLYQQGHPGEAILTRTAGQPDALAQNLAP